MDKDILDQAKDDFKRCHDAESSQRKMSEDDLEFAVLEKQWPQDVENQRKNEGRPCLTINRLPSFIKQVTNDSRLNRPNINVKPAGRDANRHTARILTDLTRNIWTVSQGDVAVDTAVDFAATMGYGYMRVNVDYTCDDSWDQDIFVERVANPFSVYGDPDSVQATSVDWNLCFVTDWYTKGRFQAKGWKWGDMTPPSFESDGKEDLWYDGEKVRVAEYWTRSEVATELVKLTDGKLMQADEVEKIQDLLAAQGIGIAGTRPTKTYKVRQRIVTAKDVLEDNVWLGKYIPIVPMYGEEWNINGKRHFISLVRRAKDPQRMFNYWRTAATELVALAPKAPYVGAVGAFSTDAAKWQTANTTSHPYVEYDPVPGEPPPQRQAFSGVPAGALQEALNASDDMKAIMGLHDASLGARSNETSGKAILARQREGDTSTFNFMDNRNRCVEHVGRIILDLIPQVYTTDRIMRCVMEDGTAYNAPINQPVVQPQQFQAVMQGQNPPPPTQDGAPEYMPVPQGLEMQVPQEQMEKIRAITQVFDLTTGKYDAVVTAGPSFTTRREESAEQMMEFIRVFPQSAPLIGDLLAKNLDWPGADQVAERLKAMLPPQAQGQINAVVQQLQGQLQQQGQALQEAQMKLTDKTMDNQLKARELSIKEFEAETERIKTIREAEDRERERQTRLIEAASRPQTPPGGGVPVSGGQNTAEQPPAM
jgi:hypothetical protein